MVSMNGDRKRPVFNGLLQVFRGSVIRTAVGGFDCPDSDIRVTRISAAEILDFYFSFRDYFSVKGCSLRVEGKLSGTDSSEVLVTNRGRARESTDYPHTRIQRRLLTFPLN